MNSSGRTHSSLSPLLRWVLQLPPTKVPNNTHLHEAAMKSVTHNLSLLFLLLSAELPVFCSLRISCTSASFLLSIFSNVSYSLFCKTELFSFFFFSFFFFFSTCFPDHFFPCFSCSENFSTHSSNKETLILPCFHSFAGICPASCTLLV